MHRLVLLLVCLLSFSGACAQKYRWKKDYRVWVKTYEHGRFRGTLYRTTDSSIFVTQRRRADTTGMLEIPVKEIKRLSSRRNYELPARIIESGMLGFSGAFLTSYIFVDGGNGIFSFSREFIALLYGVTGAGGGLLIGAAIFSPPVIWRLRGSQEKFNTIKSELQKRSVVKT